MRIALFLLTNLAVLVLGGITLSLLGVQSILDESGTGLDLTSLLIFCGALTALLLAITRLDTGLAVVLAIALGFSSTVVAAKVASIVA